jgi:hypothetical protein
MQNEPIEVTLKVTRVLEGLGIPYLIGGSLASTLHGMVRTTQDADVIAEMRSKHILPFVEALQSEFFLDEEMIAYAKTINKAYQRTGSLFQHPFGRVPIKTDRQFWNVIAYIHQNPQKHGFVKDFRDWKWSSDRIIAVEKKRSSMGRGDSSMRSVVMSSRRVMPDKA